MSEATLNPAQRQAVEHQDGPLLVLAGAGSGKTRVITHRICRMIERGVPARAIVALTFTNKAAGEMRERIAHMLGKKRSSTTRALTISTFHSFGLNVLTKERAAIGGVFTIFDQGDVFALVKDLLRGAGASKSFDAAAVLARISNAKNAFLEAEQLAERAGDEYDEIAKVVYPRYQAALRQYKAFDFDDLVCEVARLFARRPDVLERWQEQYRYLLVDEYQDTNHAQLEMLRHLASKHRNVCVVGDDDQSIYAWRGADVRNILEFEEHFPGATIVKLEQNYRSRAPILSIANAVIAKRVDAKYPKVLFTEKQGGEIAKLLVAPSPEIEAQHVGREVRRFVKDEGRPAREVAVLYRSNGQAKLIEDALREQGIPYRMIGGQQFYERKEVKDVLAYLKLVVNPSDEISLRRVVNYPARGIGETSLERLALAAAAQGWSLWQAVERVDAIDGVSDSARDGCKELVGIVADTRRDFVEGGRATSDVVRSLCERIALKRELDASSPPGPIAARRWSNVESLFTTFARREAKTQKKGDMRELASFLQALTLDFGDDEETGTGDAVTLSTLHGAKGLEFDVVFLIGCEEGFLPHSRTLDARATDAAPADIEEERRLFYVGVTRAKELLFLSRAKARVLRGKATPRTPSRFLGDVPPELVEEIEVRDQPSMSTEAMTASANALLAMLDSLG